MQTDKSIHVGPKSKCNQSLYCCNVIYARRELILDKEKNGSTKIIFKKLTNLFKRL